MLILLICFPEIRTNCSPEVPSEINGNFKWQMQMAGLRPDVVSYTLLISAYGKARREEEALAVFEEMFDAGVRPTRKAYNILLDAFAVPGMVDQARTVFKSMRRDRYTSQYLHVDYVDV
ncbi:hypothetical protein L3X38_019076 [Prunus dulcis]|uniref:Tetratricopeptide repeat-like superfamily protein n=1 Tax=Prunus dulcis TaxID=3755 RepID=A0AAD4ZBQ9_PRUDU|nr:hypothetical protein L3X38_019076 [Prunus dulcis]